VKKRLAQLFFVRPMPLPTLKKISPAARRRINATVSSSDHLPRLATRRSSVSSAFSDQVPHSGRVLLSTL